MERLLVVSNKVVIKHINKSSYEQAKENNYNKWIDHGTLITVFYEDA